MGQANAPGIAINGQNTQEVASAIPVVQGPRPWGTAL